LWGKGPVVSFKRKFGPLFLIPGGSPTRFGLLLFRSLCAMDKKPSTSKPNLSPQERIELLRTELESIKATTAKHKWEMLAIEMQDIKDDLSDELQAGLKDAAILMGNLGKRLAALEIQVEGLTTALGKIVLPLISRMVPRVNPIIFRAQGWSTTRLEAITTIYSL
jgi:hypothetical protein